MIKAPLLAASRIAVALQFSAIFSGITLSFCAKRILVCSLFFAAQECLIGFESLSAASEYFDSKLLHSAASVVIQRALRQLGSLFHGLHCVRRR